jgi:hypothetical protein
MAILLGYRGEQHVPRALESGQLSGHCGLRIGLNGERPVAIDPTRTLGSLVLAELFVPRPGQYEVFWMGVGSCSLL